MYSHGRNLDENDCMLLQKVNNFYKWNTSLGVYVDSRCSKLTFSKFTITWNIFIRISARLASNFCRFKSHISILMAFYWIHLCVPTYLRPEHVAEQRRRERITLLCAHANVCECNKLFLVIVSWQVWKISSQQPSEPTCVTRTFFPRLLFIYMAFVLASRCKNNQWDF